MAHNPQPTISSTRLGASAEVRVLPDQPSSGTGAASQSGLFPAETSLPIAGGGMPPSRLDFNALFAQLGATQYYLQHGGIFGYDATVEYDAGAFVRHGGNLYRAVAANGASEAAGVVTPGTNPEVWAVLGSNDYNDLINKPAIPSVGNGTLTLQRNGTEIGTFTANQSGSTSVNISVPTVGNGVLTIQQNGSTVGTFTANQSGNTVANIKTPSVPFPVGYSQADDTTLRAAGYWRCGRAYTAWNAYSTGSAGAYMYIVYAPAGYKLAAADLVVLRNLVHRAGSELVLGFPEISAPTGAEAAGVVHTKYANAPTSGMTSAQEYDFPGD